MAVTQNSYTGNGSTTTYSFTFPYLKAADIKASIDATVTTAFTLPTATTLQFNTAPANGAKIKIYRETGSDALTATFYAGSAVKSEDLNDNFTQNLYGTQEVTARYLSNLGGTMVGDLTLDEDADIVFEGATADAHETTLTVIDPTADRTISLPNVTGTVITTGDTGTVTSTIIADGTIATGDIANSAVTNAKIAADAVNGSKIADDSINSEHYVDGSIDTAHIADLQITTGKIAADAITNPKIANSSIDSNHYVNGSIDSVHLANSSVTTGKIAADAVNGGKIADDSINSEHYVDGSIDTAHIADSQITTAKIADSAVTTGKINDDAVTTAKIPDNAITTAKIADAELSTLAGMQTGTASILAGGTALTSTLSELNLLDGKSVVTAVSGSSTDVQLPTAKAVNDQILAVTNALGGFVAIADKDNFPTSNPDPSGNAGTIVSIADAVGISVNSSGVGSLATRAGGSSAVIINGFPSALRGGVGGNANPNVLTAGQGLQVQTTSTAHTYDYHKLIYDEGKAATLQAAVDDFDDRYYGGASSNPSTKPSGGNRTDGDLYFNTSTNKMKVFNGNHSSGTWDDVATPGDFYINTIASYSGTGGNSATFNGSAYRFVLSNPPTSAQQLVVSVNGVVQKPNAGTSQPSEGFAIDGSSIIFSSAPASGSDYFIITIGSSVNIGTPSDNTISTAKIQNSAVTTDKLAADSVTGAKIADDAVGAEHIEVLDAALQFADNANIQVGTGNDLEIRHTGSHSYIDNDTGNLYIRNNVAADVGGDIHIRAKSGENSISCLDDGAVTLYCDDEARLATNTVGVSVSGPTGDVATLDVTGAEGRSAELVLIADEGDDYTDKTRLHQSTNGRLYIQNETASANWESQIVAIPNGAVELYNNGTKQCETSDVGLKFPAGKGVSFDPYAGSGVNLLDDYEEGTFTPTYGGSSSNPTITYDDQQGVYTKIGRQVTVHLRVRTDAVSGGSGDLRVNGLPFTAGNYATFGGYITFTNNWKADSAPTLVNLNGNTTYFKLYKREDGNEDASLMDTDDLTTPTNDNDVRITATYIV